MTTTLMSLATISIGATGSTKLRHVIAGRGHHGYQTSAVRLRGKSPHIANHPFRTRGVIREAFRQRLKLRRPSVAYRCGPGEASQQRTERYAARWSPPDDRGQPPRPDVDLKNATDQKDDGSHVLPRESDRCRPRWLTPCHMLCSADPWPEHIQAFVSNHSRRGFSRWCTHRQRGYQRRRQQH